jgi:hypothetical protein
MTEDRLSRAIVDRVRREHMNGTPAWQAELALRPFEIWISELIGHAISEGYSDGYRDGQFAHEDGAARHEALADVYDLIMNRRWQEFREEFRD